MGNRRKSRELAMQALFSMDMSQNGSKDILERFCDNFKPSSKALSFFLKLVQGVLHTRTEIDAVIERYSKNWKPRSENHESSMVARKGIPAYSRHAFEHITTGHTRTKRCLEIESPYHAHG